ncbi:MAG: DUF3089 domain-containing protein, partial [Lachnospiraceae bacterium]|nr:DUF3089 domain-containing protein [Lachnospiraceae bacterium]
MLKKLFGGIKMSWPKVVIFAVIAGVYTALMAIYVPETNSFHDIVVYAEAWILFAVIIVTNCDKPLEAAIKTFVFFLISQPIVYLVQVPFSALGWQIFGYYKYWFIITLLTFPGAFVAWFIKKNHVVAGLILSVALGLIIYQGMAYVRTLMIHFPNHLLSAIFCFALVSILIFGVLRNKLAKIVAGGISIVMIIVMVVMLIAGGRQARISGNVLLDDEYYQIDENWTVSVEDEDISTGEIREKGFGGYELFMHYYKAGSNTVTLTDGEGNAYRFIITMDENTSINVKELDGPDAKTGNPYAAKRNWAYFREGEDKDADLFIICPTVDMKDEFNMSLDDEDTKSDFIGALNMERGIYEDNTRMYAPFYRQAAMKVYSLTAEEQEEYMQIAYEDISMAFAWYLEHENDGRPIILAGFSQGADMCYRLLEEYFGDKELYSRLIAVYALGWPCTEELVEKYPQIKPASSEIDTGVVISFDCEDPELEETLINPAGQKAYAINPLNWKTDDTKADKSENLGACFTDSAGQVEEELAELCGCYLDTERGVVKVTDVDPADYPPVVPGLPDGAYHIYDYKFFYRNLQKNVADRIDAYFYAEGDPVVTGLGIMHEEEFGGAYIDITIDDFNRFGFEYGDSVNITFSNGYKMDDLPYYNGYYTQTGEPLLVAYPGYPYIKACINNGDDLWDIAGFDEDTEAETESETQAQLSLWAAAGLSEEVTADITLNKRGAYLDIQNARDIHYKDDRELFESDEEFANFRSVKAGDIREGMLCRSASPCDNQHNRAPYSDKLIEAAGVKYILDLADTDEKIQNYMSKEDYDSPYFRSLYENGNVLPLALNMNFGS